MGMWDDAPAARHAPAVVDVVFTLEGRTLGEDHGLALGRAVCAALPWFAGEALAGVHPIRGAESGTGELILSRRTTLSLRVPRERVEDALALCGAELDVDGHRLRVGAGKARELRPHGAIHAYFVVTDHNDEMHFAEDIGVAVDALGVKTRMVCGKPHALRMEDGTALAYSLALYDLTEEDSLRLQERGLGYHRKFGCGLFVPHKSFNAVGFL